MSDEAEQRVKAAIASVLTGGSHALVRASGEILLGVQLQASSDAVSRDLGTALYARAGAADGGRSRPQGL